jgi:predicted RNase H-like HicB family nuclease
MPEKKKRKPTAVFYDLRIQVEELDDGGDYRYMATSPDLPNLLVAGDTVDEVLALAPQVASALIASMKTAGDPLPARLHAIPALPLVSHISAGMKYAELTSKIALAYFARTGN